MLPQAAAGPATYGCRPCSIRLQVMESCLKQLHARLAFLFDALARQLGARRAGLQRLADAPADMPSLQAANPNPNPNPSPNPNPNPNPNAAAMREQ